MLPNKYSRSEHLIVYLEIEAHGEFLKEHVDLCPGSPSIGHVIGCHLLQPNNAIASFNPSVEPLIKNCLGHLILFVSIDMFEKAVREAG